MSWNGYYPDPCTCEQCNPTTLAECSICGEQDRKEDLLVIGGQLVCVPCDAEHERDFESLCESLGVEP